MKLIEVIADSGHMNALAGLAEQHKLVDHWYTKQMMANVLVFVCWLTMTHANQLYCFIVVYARNGLSS